MKERVSNRKFSEQDQQFMDSCRANDILPTKRQASKFRMKKGIVYKNRVKEV